MRKRSKSKELHVHQRFMAAFIYTHVFEMFFFYRHCHRRRRLNTFTPRLRIKINKTFTLYFLIFTAIFSLYSFLIVYSLLCIFCCCNFYMVFEVSNIVTLCFEWARKCKRKKTLRLYKIKTLCLFECLLVRIFSDKSYKTAQKYNEKLFTLLRWRRLW